MALDLTKIAFVQARNYTKGRIKPVQLLVIHSMEAPKKAGTAKNVARYFATSAPASAHYCIDNGEIVQCVKVEDTAWQCKNANANGIGLEHAGYASQTAGDWMDDYGKAMLELSAELSAALCLKYSIPVARAIFTSAKDPKVVTGGFCFHSEVPLHGSHTDPGLHFPIEWYIERVQAYFSALQPTDDDPQDT